MITHSVDGSEVLQNEGARIYKVVAGEFELAC